MLISQTNVCSWVYFSQWGCSLFLNTWNAKISKCDRKHFRLYYIRTSRIFYKEVLELWYLIGKKEFGKKWLNVGNLTNIFYQSNFFTDFFLPTIHYYRFYFILDFLFFFLIALSSKCLKNTRMQRLGIFSLNSELYTFFFIRNHFIRNLVLYLPFHSPTFPYYILTSWTWKERRISNRNQLTHGPVQSR